MTAPVSPVSPPPVPITTGKEFLLQIFRCFAGYGIMFSCLLLLLRRPPWGISAVDVVFWVTHAIVLYLHRRTASVEGTLSQWGRLVLWQTIVAALLWIACQSVQPLT
jgi:hypothetical protein